MSCQLPLADFDLARERWTNSEAEHFVTGKKDDPYVSSYDDFQGRS
jgi:hypothetical protein